MGLFCRHWMWALLFCLTTGFVYSQSIKAKKVSFVEYSRLLEDLEKEKQKLSSEKEELLLRMASQTDPAWIETILMRDLGVVPEGYLKVYFKK